MADLLESAARLRGDAPALRWRSRGNWHSMSLTTLEQHVGQLGAGLGNLEIEHGDAVAILSRTRHEWTCLWLAIAAIGGQVIPVYPTSSPEECAWVLSSSSARVVVCEDAQQVAKIDSVRHQLPELSALVAIEQAGGDVLSYARLVETPAGDVVGSRRKRVTVDDTFVIVFTSGSTGTRKGCVISHGNMRALVDMVAPTTLPSDGDVVHAWLPCAHLYALQEQASAINVGAVLAFGSPDPSDALADAANIRPAHFPVVPRILEKAMTEAVAGFPEAQVRSAVKRRLAVAGHASDAPSKAEVEEPFFRRAKEMLGGRIRAVVVGGAPIGREVLDFFAAAGVPIYEGYGLTETSGYAAANSPIAHRRGTVGQPLPGQEVTIADDGEVLLRGPNIFQGYLHDAEATARVLEGGWLHTGDVGSLDEDGFLRITGRKKELIITAGGKNISPSTIENELCSTPSISQAVVFGDRRPYLVALLTVSGASEHDFSQERLREAVEKVNQRLSRPEQIKHFAVLPRELSVEAGELTESLKLRRNVIYERYRRQIDELYDPGSQR